MPCRLHPDMVRDPREELKNAKQSISVTLKGQNEPITVKFGGVARVATRGEHHHSQPNGRAAAYHRAKIPTNYRYAQLEGNPQLFMCLVTKWMRLFAKAGELVEPRVAPFNVDDVWAFTVERPGKPPVVLSRKKGEPKATNADENKTGG